MRGFISRKLSASAVGMVLALSECASAFDVNRRKVVDENNAEKVEVRAVSADQLMDAKLNPKPLATFIEVVKLGGPRNTAFDSVAALLRMNSRVGFVSVELGVEHVSARTDVDHATSFAVVYGAREAGSKYAPPGSLEHVQESETRYTLRDVPKDTAGMDSFFMETLRTLMNH